MAFLKIAGESLYLRRWSDYFNFQLFNFKGFFCEYLIDNRFNFCPFHRDFDEKKRRKRGCGRETGQADGSEWSNLQSEWTNMQKRVVKSAK